MWQLQHQLRRLADNQQQMQRMLRSSAMGAAHPVTEYRQGIALGVCVDREN